MTNSFSYLELHTTAPAAAKDFYRRLFDWKTQDTEIPGAHPFTYTELDPGGGPRGGLMPQTRPGVPSHWMVYVDVPDLAAATKKAKDLGATVTLERQEIPEGAFSMLLDPTGAAVGLFQRAAGKKS